MSIPATTTLWNGVEMPRIALGTAPLSGSPGECSLNPNFIGFFPERVHRSVELALSAGIRHIDTALIYRSHGAIARVLGHWFREGKLKREDVFITSKVYHPPSENFGLPSTTIDMDNMTVKEIEEAVHAHFQQTLMELGVGYVDLMLLHWPASGGGAGQGGKTATQTQMAEIDPMKRSKRIAAWKVLEHYYSIGWARAIGVSNFHEVHLEHLMDDGAKIRPMVNQVETSIYIQQEKIIDYCQKHNIAVMAYSPLGRGVMNIDEDEVVTSIANKHGVTPGHVALGFLLHKGFALSCWSSSEGRIKANASVCSLQLDADDMEKLSALNRSESWGLPSPYMLS